MGSVGLDLCPLLGDVEAAEMVHIRRGDDHLEALLFGEGLVGRADVERRGRAYRDCTTTMVRNSSRIRSISASVPTVILSPSSRPRYRINRTSTFRALSAP